MFCCILDILALILRDSGSHLNLLLYQAVILYRLVSRFWSNLVGCGSKGSLIFWALVVFFCLLGLSCMKEFLIGPCRCCLKVSGVFPMWVASLLLTYWGMRVSGWWGRGLPSCCQQLWYFSARERSLQPSLEGEYLSWWLNLLEDGASLPSVVGGTSFLLQARKEPTWAAFSY